MLIEFESALIERLKAKVIPNVQGWSGKPEELFLKPKTYPALRVLIEGVELGELHSPYAYVSLVKGSIILFFATIKDKAQGAYSIIEKIINALSGFDAVGYEIRIKKIELLYHENTDFAYTISYEGLGRYVVPYEEDEVLTKKIKLYEGEELISEVSK
mgnify:CR=1 FL=1